MRKLSLGSGCQLLALTGLALVVWTPPALAYVDPTAAGAALQSLYILAVSVAMSVALLPKKVAALFGAIKSRLFRSGGASTSARPGKD
jgi:hypothetical protein